MLHEQMNPGAILPNGAVVIAASAREYHTWIILAMYTDPSIQTPYATWKCRRPGDGSDAHAGRYFNNISDAAADARTRP